MSTRVELTRQAEACLRQGRMDDAIARYQELADLLERAGQPQAAAQQFVRWADHLSVEGFNAKAAALYKKVLKLAPRDEHALWQLGEVSLALKLRADARLAFQRVAELRQARGDASGAELARVRLAELEGSGPTAGMARATSGMLPASPPGAVAALPGAPSAPTPVLPPAPVRDPLPTPEPVSTPVPDSVLAPVATSPVVLAPDPPTVPRVLEGDHVVSQPPAEPQPPVSAVDAVVAIDGPADGLRAAEASAELPVLPLSLGRPQEPGDPPAIPDAASLAPSTAPVTEAPLASDGPGGQPASPASAAPVVGPTLVFDWSDLLGREVEFAAELASLSPAEADQSLAGASKPHEAAPAPHVAPDSSAAMEPMAVASTVPTHLPHAEDLQAVGPASREEAVEPAAAIPAAGPVEDRSTDTAETADGSPAGTTAAAVTGTTEPVEAITLTPPALPRVGALRAQPLLLEESPLQPSFSMPKAWLTPTPASDEADPPQRRAPEDDFFFTDDATPARWAPRRSVIARDMPPSVPDQCSDAPVEVEPPAVAPPPEAPTFEAGGSQTSDEVDLTRLLEELARWDPALPEPRASMEETASTAAAAPPAMPDGGAVGALPVLPFGADALPDAPLGDALPMAQSHEEGSEQLDAVFADVQRHIDDRSMAEQQLAAGRVFLAAGLAAEAARAFERASGEPRTRFAATAALAELHRSRSQVVEAVGWYEQAAMAPVPDAAVRHAVLYDLAESLEELGEGGRALGVLLDLLSQVEDYRDARAKVDRLLRIDAGG